MLRRRFCPQNLHEVLRVAVGDGTDQDGVGHREHRDRRPDADGQRADGQRGKAGAAAKHADGVAGVVPQALDEGSMQAVRERERHAMLDPLRRARFHAPGPACLSFEPGGRHRGQPPPRGPHRVVEGAYTVRRRGGWRVAQVGPQSWLHGHPGSSAIMAPAFACPPRSVPATARTRPRAPSRPAAGVGSATPGGPAQSSAASGASVRRLPRSWPRPPATVSSTATSPRHRCRVARALPVSLRASMSGRE